MSDQSTLDMCEANITSFATQFDLAVNYTKIGIADKNYTT